MQSAPLPANETLRLKALRDLAILDTETEFLYDDVTELASQICETPICLVSLVDAERQWFKSRHGLAAEQTPREFAFCAHAILGGDLFEVEDSRKDARFHDNPVVTNAPNVVFYAGIPLDLGGGVNVGTLCVIDRKPKRLSEKQKSALRCLSNQVVAHLRLRRANQQLQKALNAKSTFLASMSHEIRTPMNGILGITNLLIESTRDKDTLDQLHIVRSCGDILLTLLNDILDFSKLESGKVQFESHPFNLGDVIRNVCDVLAPIASAKGIGIEVDAGGPEDWLTGDATRITQVVMNLLGNAIKFTAVGKVYLTAVRKPAGPGLRELEVSVRDQGTGIPPEGLSKLFQSFSQVDASTTRKYGGTGLGLAICKGLVEGMGGAIGVESEVGKGSTFHFTLPCGTAEAPAAKPSWTPVQSGGPLSASKPLTILIAEDNRVNQIVAMQMMAKLGYSADLAANGEEVLRMLDVKKYDLILMDCQMPIMDGFEATEKIMKMDPQGVRPAIYALTAAVTEEERARCLQAGMGAVLQKPISFQALRQALQDFPAPGVPETIIPDRGRRPG